MSIFAVALTVLLVAGANPGRARLRLLARASVALRHWRRLLMSVGGCRKCGFRSGRSS